MLYEILYSKSFRKAFKRVRVSKDFDAPEFEVVVDALRLNGVLHSRYKDHQLSGDFKGYRECHVQNDLLLIYEVDNILKVITLMNIGSHSQLFG